MNLSNIAQNFSDEPQARRFLERMRWPEGPVCPHCGLLGDAYRLEADPESDKPVRKGVWKCRGCQKQFTVTVGTIFEDSHIPLNKWLMAIHFMCASKKGMSSHQLHRMLGVTYKTAWFMTHRIRWAMAQESFQKLTGTVEADETYIGGKKRTIVPYRPKPGERPQDRKAPTDDKAPVLALVQRDGNVYSRHVKRVTAENLKPVIAELVAENAKLITDSGTVLRGALMGREHYQVNHKADEYVRYQGNLMITTNTVEGFFSILKRGINGVYHHVGKQHLHRYLSEFDFRYNNRKIKDNERSLLAIRKTVGKRLKYRDTKPKAEAF